MAVNGSDKGTGLLAQDGDVASGLAADDWQTEEYEETSTPGGDIELASLTPVRARSNNSGRRPVSAAAADVLGRSSRRSRHSTPSHRKLSLRLQLSSLKFRWLDGSCGGMAGELSCWLLVRLVLPLTLIAGCCMQFDALSSVYLLLLLICPNVPSPSRRTWNGLLGVFVKLSVCLSWLALLPPIVFQLVLFSLPPYAHFLHKCDFTEQLLRHLGLISLQDASALTVVFYVMSRLLPAVVTLVVFRECRSLARHGGEEEADGEVSRAARSFLATSRPLHSQQDALRYCFVTVITMLSLTAAATLRPNLVSLLYLLQLLAVSSWWACCRQLLGRAVLLANCCRVCMVLAGAHVLVLYGYQLQWSQQLLPTSSLIARLSGLIALKVTSCSDDPRDMHFVTTTVDNYLYPFSIYLLYYMLATASRMLLDSRVALRTMSVVDFIQALAALQAPFGNSVTAVGRSLRRTMRRKRAPRDISTSSMLLGARDEFSRVAMETTPLMAHTGGPGRSYRSMANVQRDEGGVDSLLSSQQQPQQQQPANHWSARVSSLLYTGWHALTRVSFLATYIVMMYWSIKFHSWPTLVFLVWALLVAVIRSQRRVLFRSSPLLVLYAQLLLLGQYVFCLPLSETELPARWHGFWLHDLFYRPRRHPCLTLALQLCFTAVFWLTLRQYLSEERSRRGSTHQQSTVSSAASASAGAHTHDTHQASPRMRRVSLQEGFVKRCVAALTSLVVRLWIVVLALLLFVYGVGQGDDSGRVTLFQIVYMAFFLVFVCLFQLSFSLWRRVLYTFVTFLIVYQMLVLVSIYLYQFKQVNEWLTTIGVSPQWQHNIGLQVYGTGRLFVKLLFPAIFMIVCVVYAQHVHTEFMLITDIDNVQQILHPSVGLSPVVVPLAQQGRTQQRHLSGGSGASRPASMGVLPEGLLEIDTDTGAHRPQINESADLAEMSNCLLVLLADVWNWTVVVVDRALWLACRLAEIHSIKACILALVLAAILDVCAAHTVFVLLACITLQLGSRGRHVACGVALCWLAVMTMLRIVYQMGVVPDKWLVVNCTKPLLEEAEIAANSTAPNISTFASFAAGGFMGRGVAVAAVQVNHLVTGQLPGAGGNGTVALSWLGVEKRADLLQYLTGYIAVLVVFTLHKVVQVRALFLSRRCGAAQLPLPGVVFDEVTRQHADDGIVAMLKYLVNYGFYKFGVEVCLIATVTLIGFRVDLIALLYVVWLGVLFSLRRSDVARLWPAYVAFIASLLCLQYLSRLGLPPVLCIDYPFIGVIPEPLRMWLFFPNYLKPPHSDLLIADMFLLVLAFCQKRVFAIELAEDSSSYPGGSNEPISEQQLRSNYVNPVPDFTSTKGNYLNVMKQVLFFSSFWLTLAVVCLAGVSRTTLLSLLYVVGAFVFLWMGNDFYLLSHTVIRQRWLLLLSYNVAAIALKSTVLQIIGCQFLTFFQHHALWLVKLLGAGCLNPAVIATTADIGGGGAAGAGGDDADNNTEAGMLLDGLVFACLVLQLRFFGSHYFQHVVEETRAQQILANCGAELIRRELKKTTQKRHAQEERAMADIQTKMQRIQEQRLVKNKQKHDNHYRVIHSCAAEDLEMDLERENVRRRSRMVPTISSDYERPLSPSESLMCGMSQGLAEAARHATRARLGSGSTYDQPQQQPPTQNTSTDHDRSEGATGRPAGASILRRRRHTATSTQSTDQQQTSQSRDAERSDSSATTSQRHVDVQDQHHDHHQHPDDHLPSQGGQLSSRSAEHATGPAGVMAGLLRRLVLLVKTLGHFSLELLASCIISLIAWLNSVSEDYRFIARQLARKKRRLKETWRRQRSVSQSENSGSSSSSSSCSATASEVEAAAVAVAPADASTDAAQPGEHSALVPHEGAPLVSLSCEDITVSQQAAAVAADVAQTPRSVTVAVPHDDAVVVAAAPGQHPTVMTSSADHLSSLDSRQIAEQLAVALWYAVVSRSEMVAYIVVFVNQMASASIMSLPLPMMVFLWGSLSMPRPSKTFWVTMIAYLEVIIIIKYMFQFPFFLQNHVHKANEPFWPPRIIGIERRDYYAVYDLILLLVAFFHRMVMKSLGLWKDVDSEADDIIETVDRMIEARADGAAAVEDVSTGGAATGGGVLVAPTDSTESAVAEVAMEQDATKDELLEGFKYYMSSVEQFFAVLLHDCNKKKADVYAYMFLCDFINIFVVFIGFSAFGPPQGSSGGDISSVVEENKVPVPFLIILSLNFLLILLDRGIYLRKSIRWKLVFQYALVLLVHGWLFFILPAMTGREFSGALAPRIWYIMKCVYLLFSAHQIRSGYPTRILGNFLTKQFSWINKYAFRGFMMIPFLYELRALMDWLWTKTSLDIFNWLKMEDIYAHIFISKCQREQEEAEMYVSGEPRRASEKCLLGGGWLAMIVAVIFAPLVLFALSNAVGLPNRPLQVELELTLGSYERMVRIRTSNNGILNLNQSTWDTFDFHYRSDRHAQGFLADFNYNDVSVVQLNGDSAAVWAISPPSQRRMIRDLESAVNLSLVLSWKVRRSHESADATGFRTFPLPAIKDGARNPLRTRLASMLRGDLPADANITLAHIFPKFLRITNQGKAELPRDLEDTAARSVTPGHGGQADMLDESLHVADGASEQPALTSFRSLVLKLMRDNSTGEQWWQVNEDNSDGLYRYIPYWSPLMLTIMTFSQRVFPSTLTFFTGAGIIGTYTTFVLVIQRLCRTSFVDISFHIMFDDMPYVDRILQICEDIYLVRENGNLKLEEELFAKLIFLYRSPEMLIKYTEPPPPEEQLPPLPAVFLEARRRSMMYRDEDDE